MNLTNYESDEHTTRSMSTQQIWRACNMSDELEMSHEHTIDSMSSKKSLHSSIYSFYQKMTNSIESLLEQQIEQKDMLCKHRERFFSLALSTRHQFAIWSEIARRKRYINVQLLDDDLASIWIAEMQHLYSKSRLNRMTNINDVKTRYIIWRRLIICTDRMIAHAMNRVSQFSIWMSRTTSLARSKADFNRQQIISTKWC